MRPGLAMDVLLPLSSLTVTSDGGYWYDPVNDVVIGGFGANQIPQGVIGGQKYAGVFGPFKNLLAKSQAFDGWAKSGASVVANDATAPDGTTTADKITYGGSGQYVYVTINNADFDDNKDYTLSTFWKHVSGGAGSKYLYQRKKDGGFGGDSFTLGSSWQRDAFTVDVLTGVANPVSRLQEGGGASVIHAWQADLVKSSYPVVPIATAGSQVTRAADIVYWPGGVAPWTAIINGFKFRFVPYWDDSDTNVNCVFYRMWVDANHLVQLAWDGVSPRIKLLLVIGGVPMYNNFVSGNMTLARYSNPEITVYPKTGRIVASGFSSGDFDTTNALWIHDSILGSSTDITWGQEGSTYHLNGLISEMYRA